MKLHRAEKQGLTENGVKEPYFPANNYIMGKFKKPVSLTEWFLAIPVLWFHVFLPFLKYFLAETFEI